MRYTNRQPLRLPLYPSALCNKIRWWWWWWTEPSMRRISGSRNGVGTSVWEETNSWRAQSHTHDCRCRTWSSGQVVVDDRTCVGCACPAAFVCGCPRRRILDFCTGSATIVYLVPAKGQLHSVVEKVLPSIIDLVVCPSMGSILREEDEHSTCALEGHGTLYHTCLWIFIFLTTEAR